MQSIYRRGGLAGVCIILCACAPTPESIQPAYVSEMTYQNWTCPQLAEEETRLNAAYVTAAAQENNARSNDTLGVILLGLPLASMSGGNVAPQIANLKGQQEAVRKIEASKNCSLQPVTTPQDSPSAQAPAQQVRPVLSH